MLLIARELTAVTCASQPPSEDELLAIRHTLAQRVRAHLEREAVLVLAPLNTSPDPTHQALARAYSEGLLTLRLAGSAHYARWSIPAALADMPRYRHSARALLLAHAERIAWEEAEVLPAVAAMLLRRAAA